MMTKFFTDEETLQLALAFVDGNGGFASEDDMARWFEWCVNARIHDALVTLAGRGELLVALPEDGSEDNWIYSKRRKSNLAA